MKKLVKDLWFITCTGHVLCKDMFRYYIKKILHNVHRDIWVISSGVLNMLSSDITFVKSLRV